MSKSYVLIALALALTACGSDESTPESTGGSDSVAGSDPGTSGSDPGGSSGASGSDDPGTGGTEQGGESSTGGSDPGTGGSDLGGSDPGTGGSDPGGSDPGGSDPGIGGSDPGIGGSDPGGSDPGIGGSDPGGSDPGIGGSDPGGSSGSSGESSTGGTDPEMGGTDPGTGGSNPGIGGSSGISGESSTGGADPETGGTPSQGGNDPGTGGTSTMGGSDPGTGGTPSQGGSEPGIGGSHPGTGGTPSEGGSDPGTGGTPSQGGTPSEGGSDPGTGGTTPTSTPVQVSVGYFHTCTVLSDGHIKCWGENTYGQLGNGTSTNSPSPVLVNGISTATQVSTYSNHSCALLADGTVWCWGLNHYGQLGNEEAGYECNCSDPTIVMAPNPNPVQMVGVTGALQVETGAYTTCVILGDHTVKCVGFRRYGALGDGVDDDINNYYSKFLVQVVGIDNAIQIGSNSQYTCALLSDNTIKCWGRPYLDYPEFEADYATGASTPVLIPNTPYASQLAVGESNICYRDAYQGSYCWGSGIKKTTPTRVSSIYNIGDNSLRLSGVPAINHLQRCGVYNNPEVTPDSIVGCKEYSGSSVVIPDILDATDVAIGMFSNACAILKSGTMKCWGYPTGNSESPRSSTPVTPDGF